MIPPGVTTPCTLDAIPGAMIVATLQGEIAPRWKSAPFTKLLAVRLGPGGITLRAKACENVPACAVTVTLPGVEPAFTLTWARPAELVFTVLAERVPGPVIEKATGKFASGCPVLPLTCTTRGWPNACPTGAVCVSPETFCNP